MMKCYHLSKDIFKSITEFVPKVPKYLLSGEDNTIERICVGLTIEDCLNGLCYLPNMSNRLFYESVDYSEIVGDLYRSMKVYEFEINESDLIRSDDLRDYVPDAYKTNECWLLKRIKPIKEYIIDIISMDIIYSDDEVIPPYWGYGVTDKGRTTGLYKKNQKEKG